MLDGEKSVIKESFALHERKCGKFHVTGKVNQEYILGVCNICGRAVERYPRYVKAAVLDPVNDDGEVEV